MKVLSLFICFSLSIYAKTFTFSSLAKSLESTNPSILSSKLQTLLANEEINAAKSSLYPRLSLSANSEYSKKYANTRNNYINDESLVSSTGFASSVSLKLNYELYRFGANALNIDAAAYKKQSLSYKECVTLNEAKLRLLELYYNLLYSKDKLNSYSKLKQINKEIYETSKRLYENGDHTKTAMTNSAIRLVEIEDNIASLNKQIKNLLSEISSLSGEDIYIEDEIMPFSNEDMGGKFNQTSAINQASQASKTKSLKQAPSISPQNLSSDSLISSLLPAFEQTSEAKELNALILSKQSALESKKREYYPAFYLYAKYDFYGDDRDNFRRSWDDTQRNGYRIGLSMVYNLFDGFNREAGIQSAFIELLLAKEQFNEAKRRYEKEARNINDDLRSNLEKLKTTSELTSYSKELLSMQERLNLNSQSDKLSVLESKVKFNENLIKNEEALLQANMLTVKRFLINEKSVDCKAL